MYGIIYHIALLLTTLYFGKGRDHKNDATMIVVTAQKQAENIAGLVFLVCMQCAIYLNMFDEMTIIMENREKGEQHIGKMYRSENSLIRSLVKSVTNALLMSILL